jgi:hypothetical protein
MTTTHEPEHHTVTLAEVIEMKVGLSALVRCGDVTKTSPATSECGAQAYVEVEFRDGSRMEFCGHHYSRSEATLILQAVRIIDHRPFLLIQEGKFKGVDTR